MDSFKGLVPGDLLKNFHTSNIHVVMAEVTRKGYLKVTSDVPDGLPWFVSVARNWEIVTQPKLEKPPIELRPRRIADDQRAEEILDTMLRFVHGGKFKEIPYEWMEELVEIHGRRCTLGVSKYVEDKYYAGLATTTPSGDPAP